MPIRSRGMLRDAVHRLAEERAFTQAARGAIWNVSPNSQGVSVWNPEDLELWVTFGLVDDGAAASPAYWASGGAST